MSLAEECGMVLRQLCEDYGIVTVSEYGANKFYNRYVLMSVKWFLTDMCITFLEVFLVIVAFKFEFNFEVRNVLRWVLALCIVMIFSRIRKLRSFAVSQEIVDVFTKLCKNYPIHYIFKEEAQDGGDQEQQQL